MSGVDLLIVGAGPTGLAAACEARRCGLTVRIVDKAPHRSIFSKALVMHARTLEGMPTSLAEQFIAAGAEFRAMNVFNSTKNARKDGSLKSPAVRVNFGDLDWGDAAFPYWLSIPQYETERLLELFLERLGVQVEWGVGLEDIASAKDSSGRVVANLTSGDEECARWLVGCDGGRSTVAAMTGVNMARSPLNVRFFLADVKTTCRHLLAVQDEGRVFRGSARGILIMVPMVGEGVFRIIAHVDEKETVNKQTSPASMAAKSDGEPARYSTGDADFINRLVLERTGIVFGAHDISWMSEFSLTEGVRDTWRPSSHPCVFFAGDAAHVHSPVGGQGMNTGIQDAHNLIWKLAVANRLSGSGKTDLAERFLASYEEERKPNAQAMVKATGRATKVLTTMRGWLPRTFLSFLIRFAIPMHKNKLARPIAMLELCYKESSIIATGPGGGARVPNPLVRFAGEDEQALHVLLRRSHGGGHSLLLFSADGSCDVWTCGENASSCASVPVTDRGQAVLRRHFAVAQESSRVVLVRPDLVVAGVWPDVRGMIAFFSSTTDSGLDDQVSLLTMLRIPLPVATPL